jgi:RecA/RadA recombinase
MAKKQDKITTDPFEAIVKEYEHDILGISDGNIESCDIVTTSSFWFDYVLGGGFRSGSWSRFFAEPECGKTSMALSWARNWQLKYGEQARVVYVNAEGRLTKDLLERSGLNLNKPYFRVLWAQQFEAIYGIVERCLKEDDSLKYFFILDSTDACVRALDKDKDYNEAEKMAGGAAIASAAGKRLSLLFNWGGHHLFLCSQVRDKMNSKIPGKDAAGGNAPKFYSSLIGEIKKPWSETFIYETPNDKKSTHIGRMCQVKLHKTPNETTGKIVNIPIRYGLKGGVWRAYEAMMIAQTWKFYKTSGAGSAWWEINEEWAEDMEKSNVKFEAKVQGLKQLRDLFDSNPDLVKYCLDKGAIMAGKDRLATKVSDEEATEPVVDEL